MSSVVLAAVFFVKTVQELHPDFHLSINNVHRVVRCLSFFFLQVGAAFFSIFMGGTQTLASFLAAVLWVQEAMQANARMFDDEDFQVMEHSGGFFFFFFSFRVSPQAF